MQDRILRKTDIEHITGLSDITIREMERGGSFPRRFKLNPNNGLIVGWRESEVMAWIEERAASREVA